MPSSVLHSVPSDPLTPYAVDMTRVEDALAKIGHSPQDAHFTGSCGRSTIEGHPFAFSLFGNQDYLSVRTTWVAPTSVSVAYLFIAANSWNRTRLFPTVYIDERTGGRPEIVADMVSLCSYGLSRDQLHDELSVAVTTCSEAIDYIRWAVEQVDSIQ